MFHKVLPAGLWFVSVQNPITLEESSSEPQPCVKIVRGTPREHFAKNRYFLPADVPLVVEVSDTVLRDDLGVKKAIYARSAISTYWVVDLASNRLLVFTDPTGPDATPDYRRRVEHGPGDDVRLILDGHEVARIAVADLLP